MTHLNPALPAGPAPAPPRAQNVDESALREAARRMEAAFLSEMLRHAGLGAAREGVGGGGIGEAQFASFLRETQATAIASKGGIGLAEQLFHALKERADGR